MQSYGDHITPHHVPSYCILGGRHTHTHTHTHMYVSTTQTKEIRNTLAKGWHIPGLTKTTHKTKLNKVYRNIQKYTMKCRMECNVA